MKKINLGKKMILSFFIYWIIYNSFFGWNLKPESELEEILDLIYEIGITISLVIYFLPIVDIYENKVKKHESKINKP